MQSESLDWKALVRNALMGHKGQRILAIRADGKGYYGEIIEVNVEYVELANGSQKQLLRFFDSPTQFAFVRGPEPQQRRLADRKLV